MGLASSVLFSLHLGLPEGNVSKPENRDASARGQTHTASYRSSVEQYCYYDWCCEVREICSAYALQFANCPFGAQVLSILD